MAHWFHSKAALNFIFLHGFTGTVGVWAEVASHFPKHVGFAALPLPGHAPLVPPQPNFEATCDALVRAVRSLDCPEIHLVGYSLGARLSLGMALRHPKLMASVSLIGGHAGLETQHARLARQTQDAAWVRILREQGIERFVAAWEAQPIFASQIGLSSERCAAQRRHRLGHNPHALAASLTSTGLAVMPNLWPELQHNTVPMQLLVGSRDYKFVKLLNRMEKVTPYSKLQEIAGCGHNLVFEAPAQLAALLRDGPGCRQ